MFWGKMIRIVFVIAIAAGVISGCAQVRQTAAQPVSEDPTVQPVLAEMDRASEQMLKLAKAGAVTEAREQLMKFSELMTKVNFNGLLTIDGLDALTKTVMDARRIFNAVRYSPEQGVEAAVRLRLASDALTHKQNPMWLQFERTLSGRLTEFETAARAKNRSLAIRRLAEISSAYQQIRAAGLISGREIAVYKIDSLLVFLHAELSKGKTDFKHLASGAKHFRESLQELFVNNGRQAYLPFAENRSPFVWTVVLCSLIITVLMFVGWKKFKYGSPYKPLGRG